MSQETINTYIIFGPFIAVILFMILSSLARNRRQSWANDIKERLEEMDETIKTKDKEKLQLNLIRADKLFDHMLIRSDVKGQSTGQRMIESRSLFEKDLYNKLWDAHKDRNRLVHEHDFQINITQLRGHYRSFRQGIVQLLKLQIKEES